MFRPLKVMYPHGMAVVFKTRAGKLFRAHVNFWEPSKENLIDTSDKTAHLEIRSTQVPHRVILSAEEQVPAGTSNDVVLKRIEPGHWTITLDRSVTQSLPSSSNLSLYLVDNVDPEDVSPLFEASLRNSRS